MENKVQSVIQEKIKIYKIPVYKIKDKEGLKALKYKEYNIDDFDDIEKMNKKLSKDKSYHAEYDEKYFCCAYGDVDHCETEEKLISVLKYIAYVYEISFDDISYTLSNPKSKTNPEITEYGSHWAIPTIQTTVKTLRKKIKLIGEKINKDIKYVDSAVYNSRGFLRLPYQTNSTKKTIHKIIQGQPIDFIMNNIERCIYDSFDEEPEKEVKEYINNNKDSKPNLELLDILKNHFNNYSEWSRMGWIMKSLGYDFDLFNEYSRNARGYKGSEDCLKFWMRLKISDKINEGLLHSLAKKEDIEAYTNLNISFGFKKDEIPVETKEINYEYLVHLNDINLDYPDNEVVSNVNNFFNSDIKSLNIKSPYDTGKTQLIKRIIKKYEPKRVLWLSYRKTLTSDILGNFGEECGFKDYQEKDAIISDRLIIQLESINKLKPNLMFLDDEFEIPSYDLVIIDEIESILQQFSSGETFKGESKNSFEFIDAIIKNSNKLITLDGDLSFRGFNYINRYGSSINLINNHKKNLKKFYITQDDNKFNESIFEALANNEKIVIVSQTASFCEKIKNDIKLKNKELKVSIYTGGSSDKEKKEDLKNVIENWVQLDVLIYSPTIEAGVNFDKVHFDRCFGLVSSNCNSQRAFCQMLSRVRKFKTNEILIMAQNLDYYEIDTRNYYTFDEVKTNLVSLNIIKVEEKIENNKMIKQFSTYDINYCYNKIEELMKNQIYYLNYLAYLLINKGHKVKFLNDKPEPEKGDDDNDEKKISINKLKLLNTKDIKRQEYKDLLELQMKTEATEEHKLKIKKYVLRKSLGVDMLNEFIIDYYDSPSIISNFTHLIDIQNIKNYNDNETKEKIKKVQLINKMISTLGFKLFGNEIIVSSDFINNSQEILKFDEFENKSYTTLFNTTKTEIKTNKQFMGFINSVLSNYKLYISSEKARIKGTDQRQQVYKLKFIDGYETINELIQYKINKGFKLVDSNNIRPVVKTETYKDLIKIKEVQEIEEDDEEVIHL